MRASALATCRKTVESAFSDFAELLLAAGRFQQRLDDLRGSRAVDRPDQRQHQYRLADRDDRRRELADQALLGCNNLFLQLPLGLRALDQLPQHLGQHAHGG
jgi:hypothetical protein